MNYYTDSAKKSLWVLTKEAQYGFLLQMLTCFSAEKDSGFHLGQQVHNPQLKYSHWQPLDGEIQISEILDV